MTIHVKHNRHLMMSSSILALLKCTKETEFVQQWNQLLQSRAFPWQDPSFLQAFRNEQLHRCYLWSGAFLKWTRHWYQTFMQRSYQPQLTFSVCNEMELAWVQNPCVIEWTIQMPWCPSSVANSNITSLHLKSGIFEHVDMQPVVEYSFTNDSLRPYARCCPSVTSLTLDGQLYSNSIVWTSLFPSLTSLSLVHDYEDDRIPLFMDQLNLSRSIQSFTVNEYRLHNCKILSQLPQLHSLSLCNCHLHDRHLLLLYNLPCLTSLDISKNRKLTSQGFDAYLQSTNSSLQALDISCCFRLQTPSFPLPRSLQSFKAIGIDMLENAVLTYVTSCSQLHTLHLSSYSYVLLETIKQTFSCLRDLWINDPLSDDDLNVISHITTLNSLCINVREIQFPITWISFLRSHQTIQSHLHTLHLKGRTDFSSLVICCSTWFFELSKTQIARFQMEYYDDPWWPDPSYILSNSQLIDYQDPYSTSLSTVHLHILRNRQRHELWCRIVFLLAWMRANHDNGLQDSGLDFVRSAYWGTAVNVLYQFLRISIK